MSTSWSPSMRLKSILSVWPSRPARRRRGRWRSRRLAVRAPTRPLPLRSAPAELAAAEPCARGRRLSLGCGILTLGLTRRLRGEDQACPGRAESSRVQDYLGARPERFELPTFGSVDRNWGVVAWCAQQDPPANHCVLPIVAGSRMACNGVGRVCTLFALCGMSGPPRSPSSIKWMYVLSVNSGE